ncbi:hypothetical protein SteCoe_36113 [Stentor coeruleus]|uniref:Uncharacterized protein n=1 Tax=Stentor coeruleus TaxID=5963 RepID=A0A1R2AQV2_9CILI|nr:hypothetical protein SteCoe_36113 [Stentor coeruleus]
MHKNNIGKDQWIEAFPLKKEYFEHLYSRLAGNFIPFSKPRKNIKDPRHCKKKYVKMDQTSNFRIDNSRNTRNPENNPRARQHKIVSQQKSSHRKRYDYISSSSGSSYRNRFSSSESNSNSSSKYRSPLPYSRSRSRSITYSDSSSIPRRRSSS